MKLDDLNTLIDRLNRSGGFSFRIMLAGLLAIYGRRVVARALVERYSGNVVSIAAASNWCRRSHPSDQTGKPVSRPSNPGSAG
jgi:hypothetical protein